MAGTDKSIEVLEQFMIALVAITVSFFIVIVLVGLLARRLDREREEASPTQASQGHHS